MRKYDPEIIRKISEKLEKPQSYILQQISKRAHRDNVAQEAELVTWARALKIPTDSYIRKLPDRISMLKFIQGLHQPQAIIYYSLPF